MTLLQSLLRLHLQTDLEYGGEYESPDSFESDSDPDKSADASSGVSGCSWLGGKAN